MLALLLCLITHVTVAAQCRHSPKYHDGAVWKQSEASVFMAVSISLQDFAPSRMVCLAGAFRQRFHQRQIDILILSSIDAARTFDPYPLGDFGPLKSVKTRKLLTFSSWASHLHGVYLYDQEKQEEHIDIRPIGTDFEGASTNTRINLPVVGTPHCRLEMNGRCMVALDEAIYPDEALMKSASGTVTLAGLMKRDGSIADIKVSYIDVLQLENKDALVNAAVQNFKTWRFEPDSRQESIKIKFTYIIDPSLPVLAGFRKFAKAEINPPEVTVRGRVVE
jgi:hypothetical protein